MTEPTSKGDDAARIAQLGTALAESEERLRELDHRIKNDLQLIASVLLLQLRKAAPGPGRESLQGALERVNAVLAVHRHLRPGQDSLRMDAAALVRDVAEEAAEAARRGDVRLTFDLAPVTLPNRQAAPLALIVGELVRNALRHAFPGRAGSISVRLRREDGRIELLVADDGVGRSDEPRGFGAMLVGLMAQQLRGDFDWGDAAPGVCARVGFPEAN